VSAVTEFRHVQLYIFKYNISAALQQAILARKYSWYMYHQRIICLSRNTRYTGTETITAQPV